jgi:hypothetical protein
MYYHSQNLKKVDKTNDIINYRFWIGQKTQLSGQFVVPTKSCALEIDLCKNGWQEEALSFHLAIPLIFNLFIAFQNRFLYKILEKITKRKGDKFTNGREIGISIHSWILWISLWKDNMEYISSDPKWLSMNINFLDLLKGKSECSVDVIKEKDIEIVMPEKTYKGKAIIERRTWKYPRWFSKSIVSTDIKCDEGVQFPGKGTTSYNCGDDALFSSSTNGSNIEKAIGNFIGSVLDYRNRYPL